MKWVMIRIGWSMDRNVFVPKDTEMCPLVASGGGSVAGRLID